jgi:nucleotide-binding universal stress UspA family protein
MKSILLPTDFSKISLNAIDYTMELFRNEECEFYFLNIQKASSFVSDDLMTMSSSATIYQTIIDTAQRSIKNVINKLTVYYKNKKHSFYSVVDYDNFIDGINQICSAKSIDLIIMGTKGATGAERVLFGSNTVRVMQRCHTPVLAIPENCKYQDIDKIVFTSDYLSQYKTKELQSLFTIASLFDAKIDVLHLTKDEKLSATQKKNKAYLDKIFQGLTHEFVDVDDEELFKTVQNYVDSNNIKLVAMSSRKYSFLDRLFTRHNVEKFGFNIHIPYLVMEDTGENK